MSEGQEDKEWTKNLLFLMLSQNSHFRTTNNYLLISSQLIGFEIVIKDLYLSLPEFLTVNVNHLYF